jgi:hypothetical protein
MFASARTLDNIAFYYVIERINDMLLVVLMAGVEMIKAEK